MSLKKPWVDLRASEPIAVDCVSGRLTEEGEKGGREGNSTILAIAAVHLESLLVTINIDLDAAPGALESCYGESLMPVVRAVFLASDKIGDIW